MLGALVLVLGALALAPRVVRLYWEVRSSNPVRRGVMLARDLGCFTCHGERGAAGIRDPGGMEPGEMEVPSWSGGVWMMYVEDADEIKEFILDGVSRRRAASKSAKEERERAAIHMPSYRDLINGRDLEDLTAAFLVLSGMNGPPPDSPEGRGYEVARSWGCLSCHGPGASGGLSNPGSFTGFIPGWYGADFRDLVRSREEFDEWVREGEISRLASNPLASYFTRRQRVQMPAYDNLAPEQLDDLWAYGSWLERTGGGLKLQQ